MNNPIKKTIFIMLLSVLGFLFMSAANADQTCGGVSLPPDSAAISICGANPYPLEWWCNGKGAWETRVCCGQNAVSNVCGQIEYNNANCPKGFADTTNVGVPQGCSESLAQLSYNYYGNGQLCGNMCQGCKKSPKRKPFKY
ncbi:MAG: hypothetical protein JSS53_09295 [Proteobacteria bacterium]|nr:hypothetical protein [Pseudomonadota bacterium]